MNNHYLQYPSHGHRMYRLPLSSVHPSKGEAKSQCEKLQVCTFAPP